VFSKTLKQDDIDWQGTRVVSRDVAGEIRRLKKGRGGQVTILGSGTIVSLLTSAGLIDEYQFVTYPIFLGEGRRLFEGVSDRTLLKRTKERAFRNGTIVTSYAPA
jgi:dihydrofolate reductase